MLDVRRSADRGHANLGWLRSHHTFSFADYHDPAQMGFGALRVINEDYIAPGTGFGMHGHRDMEIVTYVLEGRLEHADSMGNGSAIEPGDVQRMSAGRGVLHSETNGSKDHTVHLLQIWITPNVRGVEPSYEQRRIDDADKRGRLVLIASPEGAGNAVRLHQDARIYAGRFDGGEHAVLDSRPERRIYVHLAKGKLSVNDVELSAGDGAKITAAERIRLSNGAASEVLVFDLPL